MTKDKAKTILLTGATGYVGGRLAPRLLDLGYRVRVMGRSLEKLSCRPWAGLPNCEVVQGDVLDPKSLERAVQGCGVVYYLVHSMIAAKKDYAEKDRRGAQNMVRAASDAGVERIIYLGGLGEEGEGLSEHLKSRNEVARILASGTAEVTFLRAAMILGAGSASFEIMRYLLERLPIMIAPAWVRSSVQPIAVSDVLAYLIGCLENEATTGLTLDIGGPDILNYEALFRIYSEEAGLPRRLILPVPFFTPKLSSYWIHLITPLPASIGRPLAEGLKNTVVVKDDRITKLIPRKLLSCREAIRLALDHTRQSQVETCWMDAGDVTPPEWPYCNDAPYSGGTVYQGGFGAKYHASPEELYEWVLRLGGAEGWLYGNGLWRIRGALDKLVGGPGLNRGRRTRDELRVGDALDFWRVLRMEPGRRIILLAEMKVPGEAVLEFQIHPNGPRMTELRILSKFYPKGLAGMAYWYALLPAHNLIFQGMLRQLARRSGLPLAEEPYRVSDEPVDACAI